MRKITSILAAAAVFAAATPAIAATEDGVAVYYGDLNLATVTGQETLERRIDQAAETACQKPSIRDLFSQQAFAFCKREAKASAMEQVDELVAAVATDDLAS